jgi:hypothetical protein
MAGPLPAVHPRKIVAIATDKNVSPMHAWADPVYHLKMSFGQDFEFGVGRAAPGGKDVGTTEAELKPKMERLLKVFAFDADTDMARRLFDQFLAKQQQVIDWGDVDLVEAADDHPNIKAFCSRALGAPYPWGTEPAPGTTRIHQALKAAKWDVTKLVAPTDLGPPAFNKGDKYTFPWGTPTGDFANGLGLMINGVQHVFVVATHYYYDKTINWYHITLRFVFFDVFGLDDNDLAKYGAKEDNLATHDAKIGITAWWQLQHQHGYAPLVTCIDLVNTYHVPAQ